jgi:uncharacterized protein YbcI
MEQPERLLEGGETEVDAERPGSTESLQGGKLLSAISTSFVAILRKYYGRGPMNAKTYVLDDLIMVVLRGTGFTPLEETILEDGDPERVVEMRHDFQDRMDTLYIETLEELTGGKVRAFLSQARVDPDITVEIFVMEQALAGFGAPQDGDPHQQTESVAKDAA